MKKLSCLHPPVVVIAMVAIMFFPVLAQAQSILSKTLVEEDGRLAYYERDAAGRIHFYFEDTAATSKSGQGSVAVYVDYNQNNQIDLFSQGMSAQEHADLDRAFLIGNGGVCTQYLYSPKSSSACGEFISGAQFDREFKSTRNSSQQHFCWEIMVPTKELTLARNNKAYVAVIFCSAPGDCKVYPEQTGEMLSQTYTIEWQ